MRLTSLYAVKTAHEATEPARPTVVAVSPDAPHLPSSAASRCLFDEDWWLDAAAPGAWDRARVEWDGEVVGDLDRFIHFHRRAYGGETSVDYIALARIFESARSRRAAEIIFLEAAGEDIAALILVWDSRMAYTWVIARDEQRNATGAFNLLMYEAALAAWRLDRILDVDGYVRPAVGAFLTKFGFDVEMRPFVNGSSPLWRCYHLARTLISSDRYDRSFRVA